MRPDQLERIKDLAERLADSFILEADPTEWPGDGTAPADMDQQTRGDRYWCKKNAMATGGVLRFTMDLLVHQPAAVPSDAAQVDADMDKRIADAERRATAAVSRALDKAKKRTFDERVHSKPQG